MSPLPLCWHWPRGWSFHSRTSLALHARRRGTSYFHGSISPPAQTGAAGDAGRGESVYGLVMSPQLAQGTGTHVTVLASRARLWQSIFTTVSSWPCTCPRDAPGSRRGGSPLFSLRHRLMPAAGRLVCLPREITGRVSKHCHPLNDFASFLCKQGTHKPAGLFF